MEFIEDHRRDVVLLAFHEYLIEIGFAQWLLVKEPSSCGENPLPNAPDKNSNAGAEPWQHVFYFLIHLVPVEDVNLLYHQLKKYVVLTEKSQQKNNHVEETAKPIMEVLQLYMDMHDAQFVRLSSQATDSAKDANILPQKYYTAEAFEKFKPDCSSPPPYRHLREMQRFGATNRIS